MLNKSERNRPLCKEPDCAVEIEPLKKYCKAHEWRIAKWIAESYVLLQRLIVKEVK